MLANLNKEYDDKKWRTTEMAKTTTAELLRIKQISRLFDIELESYVNEEAKLLAAISEAEALLTDSQSKCTEAQRAYQFALDEKAGVQQDVFDPRQRQILQQLTAVKELYISDRVKSHLQHLFTHVGEYTHVRQLVIDEINNHAAIFSRDWDSYRQLILQACGTAMSYYFHTRQAFIATEDDEEVSGIIKSWISDIKDGRMLNLSQSGRLIDLIESSPLEPKQIVKLIGFIYLFTGKPKRQAVRYSATYLEHELNNFIEDTRGKVDYLPGWTSGLKKCWQEAAETANIRYVSPKELDVPDGATIEQACDIGDENSRRQTVAIDSDPQGEFISQLLDLRRLDSDMPLTQSQIQFLTTRINRLPLSLEDKQRYIDLLTDKQGLVLLNTAQRDHLQKVDQLIIGLDEDSIEGFSHRLNRFSCGSHSSGSLTERVAAVRACQKDEINSMLEESSRLAEDIKTKQSELHAAEKFVEKSEKKLTKKKQAFSKFEELNGKKFEILKNQLNNAKEIFSQRRNDVGLVNKFFIYSSTSAEESLFTEIDNTNNYAELCVALKRYFEDNTKCREADLTSAIIQVLFHSEDGLFSVKTSEAEHNFATHQRRINALEQRKRKLGMESLNKDGHSAILAKRSRMLFFVHTDKSLERKQGHQELTNCLERTISVR